jgi:hypothetical protein
MKEPKRYYCGNGEGMFEDDKNGHWVEYSEHKAIVEALSDQLRLGAVVDRGEQLLCPICSSDNVDAEFNHYNFCRDCDHDWAKQLPTTIN